MEADMPSLEKNIVFYIPC